MNDMIQKQETQKAFFKHLDFIKIIILTGKRKKADSITL